MHQRTVLLALFCALEVLGGIASHPAAAAEPEALAKDDLVRSIDRALDFLKNQQDRTDGSWSVSGQKNPAITSLAVMAFLSAGHVPGEGPFGEAVEKGIRWVLAQQDGNGLIASVGTYEMYHHGICTLMLAEVAGMTQGRLADEVRQKLAKAVAVILQAQRKNGDSRGGWRYRVREELDRRPPADISVTGWQIMALRAAKNVGCDVPAECIENAIGYIKRSQDQVSGGFRYLPGGRVTVPCTGTSILALEICGKNLHHCPEVLKAGAFLLREQNLPRWAGGEHFFYGLYYCSQATFQLGGNYWSTYRKRLHATLLPNQGSTGSWYGPEGIGPSYSTAMGVLALTVEYRFLPIYQRNEEPIVKPE